ncbi:MAG: BCAM0308 family protein [Chromatiales bacterium]|jgi:hypothetical protein
MTSQYTGGNRPERGDRLIKERVHDPYKAKRKLSEPTVCPDCQAVYSAGRWQWQEAAPADAEEHRCPACQRIHDRVPAGYLTLSGEFFQQHHDEIMRLMHNKVETEKAEHPLKRIMGIEVQPDGATLVTFTDMHLPRGVGEAIEHAYAGELDIQYTEGADSLRVTWAR